ncbi:haloacid dehalogenase type II [Christiangramia fulva]|uniref:Haloacid dehalogenase type II n=1 Tax=Christiangramia fulva TaxID=2126553 RepID=A0A2R3Z2Z5_9FLAO|nr:haloacid dehalogenase type II [Christiangramia fulva]AVR44635.1 haloacid dehalogenase type II [Christiangramia fulva]
MKKNKPLLIFDVNETLLDLSPLEAEINSAMGNDQASAVWFSKLLHYSLVETVCGHYHDFSEIGLRVFEMIQENYGRSLGSEQIKKMLSRISELHPHPEVPRVLRELRENSFELIALSNGKPEILEQQLKYSNISQYFQHIISIEECKKYKPHAATYKYALKKADRDADDAYMIAAHGWDIAGAAYAGLKTVFVGRKKLPYPLAPEPNHIVQDLKGLKGIFTK